MAYKYKAFISYRHLAPDMQAAEKLQKLLEGYRPPKNLGKAKENWRIFRDVSELQSSSDLSEDIKNAIESSEYLIVICSPNYTESKWCMQELRRFRALHGNTNQNIITLLVSGDPKDSFPKELTFTEMTTTDENGAPVKVAVEVEPLAANITADTEKASMKKLNTEYLRIAAPLLGCDFNDLFQREKRREAARRRRIFGGAFAVLSLISVISMYSAWTISSKNVQIQKQNDQILEQNDQIKAQNVQIEKKNSDLLIENAGHLAAESENLFKESSLIPAIEKAVEALPGEDGEKPVLPEAEYALSRELGMYEHSQFVPQRALRHEYAVEQLAFMGGGKSVVTQDATGVYFWDAETGTLLRKLSAADAEFAAESGGNTLQAIFDVSLDKTGTYFHKTAAPSNLSYEVSAVFGKIYTTYAHTVDDDEPGTGGDVYLSNQDGTVWRADGATGEILWKAPAAENALHYISVDRSGDHILRLYHDKQVMPAGTVLYGDNVYLELLNCETGKTTDTVNVTDAADNMFSFDNAISINAVRGGVIYMFDRNNNTEKAYQIQDHKVSLKQDYEIENLGAGAIQYITVEFPGGDPLITSRSLLGFTTRSCFTKYDKDFQEPLWRAELPVNYHSGGKVFLMPADTTGYEHDVLAVTTPISVSFINYEDGTVLRTIQLGSEAIDISFSRRGLVMLITREGEEYVIALNRNVSEDADDYCAHRVRTMSTGVSLCSYSRGKYVTAENYSNTAYIQYASENPFYTDIDLGEYFYNRGVQAVSPDGAYAAVCGYYFPGGKYQDESLLPHLYIYETATGALTELSALADHNINAAAFADGHTLIVNAQKALDAAADDVMFRIDVPSGAAKTLDTPASKLSVLQLTQTENGVFYPSDHRNNLVFIAPDGTWTALGTFDSRACRFDKKLVNEMYAVCGSRAAVLAEFSGDDSKTAIAVHNFADGQDVLLDCEIPDGKEESVLKIFWQNAETVGVFFDDRSVSLFDAATGSRTASVSLSGTGQEPISAAAVSEQTFAVLCRDSQLYEMNAEGFTGRSCRLDFKADADNSIRASDSTDADLLKTAPLSNGTAVCAVWSSDAAWLIDPDRFAVRYRFEHFICAPSGRDIVFIRDSDRNKIGFFPIYTTDQLLDTARQYLGTLGT